jgi:hypothetical protein
MSEPGNVGFGFLVSIYKVGIFVATIPPNLVFES